MSDLITQLRQYRIGSFAIFDTVASYLGILILSPLLGWLFSKMHLRISPISWLWLTLPISVMFHIAFRQNTPLMKVLSDTSQYPFYLASVVLVFMTIMGLKDIRVI